MATWDGSYPTPNDQDYFMYGNQNSSSSNMNSWNYFPENGNNTFHQNVPNSYSQAGAMTYRQNSSVSFHSTRSENSSGQLSMGNIYPEQTVPNAVRDTGPSSIPQCLPRTSQHLQSTSYNHYKSNNYGKRLKGSRGNTRQHQSKTNGIQTDILERSTLHATANEFIPNVVKTNEEIKDHQVAGTSSGSANNTYYQDSDVNSELSNISSRDHAAKHNKQYNRKNTNFKEKDSQYARSQMEDVYRNSYRAAKKSNKPQHGRYFNNRYYSEKFYKDDHTDKRNTNASDACDNEQDPQASSLNFNQDSRQCFQTSGDTSTSERSMQDVDKERNPKHDSQQIDKQNKRNSYSFQRADSKQSTSASTEFPQSSYRNASKQHSRNKRDKYDDSFQERRYGNQNYFNQRGNRESQNKMDRFKDKDRNKGILQDSKDKDMGNWRQRDETGNRNNLQKRGQNKIQEADDDASQRERLTEQLNRGQLECLVCCECIKQTDYIWSCSNCYHVLHLKCIKKWAKSSHTENGWRCPACQNVSSTIPEEYFCFCGKTKVPEWNRRDCAHSCGEICGRINSNVNCTHKCTLLCHPGSCPQCIAMVTRYCGCTRTSQTVQCSTLTLLHCDSICGKLLDCGKHTCEKKCHHGDCGSCEKVLQQDCYCGKNSREVVCKADTSLSYSCESICGKMLECNNHKCEKVCHSESCGPCLLTPDRVTTCCCGQTPLTEKRDSCLDPIPTCDKICSKRLKCGQPGNPHTCKANCHTGNCPECELSTDVRCRCGNMDREIQCKDLTTKADDARCEKRCPKKRSCGKHKCNQFCCIDIEHICPLPCSKTLSCGRHKCELTCHKGRCQPCWRSSFDELYCECGTAVIYPPVPCGTRRPTCTRPCSREHPCGHEVLHNCHSEASCPPCTVLTQRWCYGHHELRKAVPCYVSELSCGLPCNKPISCGRHKCITICHPGPCEKPGQQCVQPCVIPRELCGHMCAAPCHDGKCPSTPCKETVRVTCQCGHRNMLRACAENSREYQRIASSILASKMADMQLGHSVDLEEVFGQGAKKQNQLKTLECNDECKVIERNRRLALGLQIVNPDLSGKLMPRYSDFMKQWAKKDPPFCQMVHDKLTELVQLTKVSKQKSRSYSFDSMNREKRRFVHESCEHFGCESQAYDQEPKRNVVATAVKDKCWLPSYSLLEIVQRESGQKKVPGPMVNPSKGASNVKTVLSIPVNMQQKSQPPPPTVRSPEPEIDYFDYKG